MPSSTKMDGMRAKAVLRAIDRLVEDEGLDQSTYLGSHDMFLERLWRATRCMSGDEFLMASEERGCGGASAGRVEGRPRQCGYAGCVVLWADAPDAADAADAADVEDGVAARRERVASGDCCSALCAQYVEKHAARLGRQEDASARFHALYELAKRERDEKLGGRNGATASTASATNGRTSMSQESNTRLAAGTKKTPIMQAVVKERERGEAPREKAPQVFDADAVDGYRLKRDGGPGEKASKRVHFPADEALEHTQEFRSHEPADEVVKSPAGPLPVTENGNGVGNGVGNAHEHPANDASAPAPARFVFNIEDPKGPVDMTSLGDMVGTLEVVKPDGAGDEPTPAATATTEAPVDYTRHPQIDALLAKTLRDGAKHFPHLTMPEELLAQLKDLDTADAMGGLDDLNDLNDLNDDLDDLDEETIAELDPEHFSSDLDSEDDVPISCQKTFFTQLYTFFDYWITDLSKSLVNGCDQETSKSARIPQVPEVITAMQRFIGIGSTTLAASLCRPDDSPDPNDSLDPSKAVIERIARLVATFRLDAALPAFDSKQWVVVSLVMLKALGVKAHPELRTLTETTAGKQRVGALLGDARFTGEELLAVVSLLLDDDV